MGSKYPRSMRGCLPLWTLMLEVALILIFFFFTSYDSTSKDHRTVGNEQGLLQDVTVMAALGLGFLTSSLWRYSWSSVAFNFCMLALGVQWAVLVDGFLDQLSLEKVVIRLSSIQRATMSALSVLISAGAILGKANLVQLLVMALIEVTAFSATRTLDKEVLHVCFDHLLGIHDTCGVHYTFGLPGLLGGIAYIVLMMQETSWIMTSVFHQMLISSGTLGLYMAMGLASGLLTGLLLNVRIWRASHVAKYFDDQAFWEFPHLAVGF
ncbi:hypothetical protein HJG60_011012 [Phyllostomus discolor]|uniref:Ammonium transporter AmtB-like domain-containing protein n=1 Tax=Phyllostomus discolor TaxID=89673 RepID=A0A834EAF3_9CHIR|nr:hypothetical protein HJG60_011012 [Phyllostomus discolor]